MRFLRLLVVLLIGSCAATGLVRAATQSANPMPACVYMGNYDGTNTGPYMLVFDPRVDRFTAKIDPALRNYAIHTFLADDISPNGNSAALYIEYRYGGLGGTLFTSAPNADRLRQVISAFGLVFTWVDDGERIAYLWQNNDFDDWWAAVATGGGTTLYKLHLTQLSEIQVAYWLRWHKSADGGFVYFYAFGEQGYQYYFLRVADLELYSFSPSHLDNWTATGVPNSERPTLTVSPDGRFAAYYYYGKERRLIITEIATGHTIPFEFPSKENDSSFLHPTPHIVWSPDSKYVATGQAYEVFALWRKQREFPTYTLMNPVIYGIDGSVYRVSGGEKILFNLDWRVGGGWTTNGDAWLYWSQGFSLGDPGKLMALYPANQESEVILDDVVSTPSTSPDGKQLLATYRQNGKLHLDMVDLTTLERTPVITGMQVLDRVHWSSDQRYVTVTWTNYSQPGNQADTFISVIDRQSLTVVTAALPVYDVWELYPLPNDLSLLLVRDELRSFSLHMLDNRTGEQWRALDKIDYDYISPDYPKQGEEMRLAISISGHKVAITLDRPAIANQSKIPDRLYIADWDRKTLTHVSLTPDDLNPLNSSQPDYLSIEYTIWSPDEHQLILATQDYLRVLDVETMQVQNLDKAIDGRRAGILYSPRWSWCPKSVLSGQ